MNMINQITAHRVFQVYTELITNFNSEFLKVARQLVAFTPDEITKLNQPNTKLIPMVEMVLDKLVQANLSLTQELSLLLAQIKANSSWDNSSQVLENTQVLNGNLANLIRELQKIHASHENAVKIQVSNAIPRLINKLLKLVIWLTFIQVNYQLESKISLLKKQHSIW
jgi:hypothetical protein